MTYQTFHTRFLRSKFHKITILFASIIVLGWALDTEFPLPLPTPTSQFSTVILAKNGEPLRSFTNSKGEWSYPVSLAEISPSYLEALLTYEDRWFWWHPGINPLALLRATWQLLKHKKIISGGSTITMQVARLLDPHQRTLAGKLKQMFRALQLEWHLSKSEILTLYLNLAPFGGTLTGVQAASLAYLGKSAHTLSYAEAALLAILPQSPTRFRPDLRPREAETARNKVLDRLAKFKIWSPTTVAEAKIEIVSNQWYTQPLSAPLLSQRLKSQITPGRPLITTLDYQLQRSLETKLASFISELPERTSVAILVVENAGLQVRAYVGSANFLDANRFGQVDMITAQRSPGSTLKPFLYGFAIEAGLIHSESLLIDAPQSFGDYRPNNFESGFSGPVSARVALQKSLNVPAVDLLNRLTPEVLVARLRQGGLTLSLPNYARPNLAIILGGASTSLEALVSVYTALARQGLSGKLRLTESDPLVNRRLLQAGTAWIIREILEHNSRPDLPEEILQLSTARQLAWKTGTSYGFRDAWAIGVTDRYTVGIWVGRPDGTPMPGYYGAITAAPILFNVVDGLPPSTAWTTRTARPPNVTRQDICWPTGQPVAKEQAQLCQERHSAWILDGMIPPTLPSSNDSQRTPVTSIWLNPDTGLRIDSRCPVSHRVRQEIARWPLLLEPFLTEKQIRQSQLPKWDPSCPTSVTSSSDAVVKITGITTPTVLRHAGASKQPPTVSLAALGGEGSYYWLVNGQVVQQTAPVHKKFRYQFQHTGEYKITLLDQGGHYDQVIIKVIE